MGYCPPDLPKMCQVLKGNSSCLNRSIRLIAKAIVITIAIKTIAYATATLKLPKLISKAIDVVRTRVSPSKLPPTMVAIPSSPKPLLKEAVTARTMDQMVSLMIAKLVLKPDAPRVLAKSLNCVSAADNALAVKLTIMGVTKMACPIIMPFNV